MSFISYAQNCEDVVLWRALKGVNKGFYIDVGAAWPEQDSVTKAFYDRGWTGINIEPNQDLLLILKTRRINDTNLGLAISDKPGMLSFNKVDDTGLSTFNKNFVQKYLENGFSSIEQNIEATTLAHVWEKYVPEGVDVHFLKVDVEGWEQSVLLGNDWTINRPWIVVVEATLPLSKVETFASWESILLNANYYFAYADGLNRFYVAKEHESNLLPSFIYPPNVFDDFISCRQYDALSKVEKLLELINQFQASNEQLKAELSAITESKSWKFICRAKCIFYAVKNIFNFMVRSLESIHLLIDSFIATTARTVVKNKKSKRFILYLLLPFPSLQRLVFRLKSNSDRQDHLYLVFPSKLNDLSSVGKSIYAILKDGAKINVKDKINENSN